MHFVDDLLGHPDGPGSQLDAALSAAVVVAWPDATGRRLRDATEDDDAVAQPPPFKQGVYGSEAPVCSHATRQATCHSEGKRASLGPSRDLHQPR